MATYPDGTLLKASGPEVDRMEGGQRRGIPDPATFNCLGLNWGAIHTISDSEWNQIPKGASYLSRADGTLLQGSGPQVYVMAGCQRHWIPDPDTFNAPWQATHRYRRIQRPTTYEEVCAENNQQMFDYRMPVANKPDF